MYQHQWFSSRKETWLISSHVLGLWVFIIYQPNVDLHIKVVAIYSNSINHSNVHTTNQRFYTLTMWTKISLTMLFHLCCALPVNSAFVGFAHLYSNTVKMWFHQTTCRYMYIQNNFQRSGYVTMLPFVHFCGCILCL
jgi:hypothetical protein